MDAILGTITKASGTGTAAAVAMAPTVATSPDVWQQLQGLQVGPRFTWLVDYIAALPGFWATGASPTINTALDEPAETVSATMLAEPSDDHILSMGLPVAPEGTQLFGLFVSRYFLLALLMGFVISRIHVLVHRQRVRPLRVWSRIAVYLPTHLLLLRALAVVCVALEKSSWQSPGTRPWMQVPIGYVSRAAQEHWWLGVGGGQGAGDVAHALWLSFATICLFDCVDVFVARLEGSPCAPYEYIGGLIERTSLYYFYGGSLRIQELVLLSVLEKLLLSHMLIMVTNGWQWRLVPTGAANLLTLHHFLFSMRNYSGSQAMYPFVQVLSMVLLGMSLLIVLTTVSIRWLAFTIDRLGIKRHRMAATSGGSDGMDGARSAVAVYGRNGAFQGIRLRNSGNGASGANANGENSAADDNDSDNDDDDSLYELTQYASLPLYPDMRRDFGVEILDLAGTCLQQYSSQVRSSGFSRQYGAMRVPLTTALDEYIDRTVARIDGTDRHVARDRLTEKEKSRQQHKQQGQQGLWQRSRGAGRRQRGSGLSVLIDDEPGVAAGLQPSSADIAAALHDTRADAVRRLSVAVWTLCAALGSYALNHKMHAVEETPMLDGDNGDDGDGRRAVVGQMRRRLGGRHDRWESSRRRGNGNAGQGSSQEEEEEEEEERDERFVQGSGWLVDGIDDYSDEDDFDYVGKASDSDSDSDSDSGGGSEAESEGDLLFEPRKSKRFNEAAELVCDLLDNSSDDGNPSSQLASAAAFVAHSLLGGIFPGLSGRSDTRPRVMTRGMIARQMSACLTPGSTGDGRGLVGPETLLLQVLSRIGAGGFDHDGVVQQTVQRGEALPFMPSEMESLAQLIQARRQQQQRLVARNGSDGADGMGSSGVGDAVLCVVCWANTRSVMLRPCRCLCLCNDCRLALVARNFDHCPCCRRSVSGYSRVYAV